MKTVFLKSLAVIVLVVLYLLLLMTASQLTAPPALAEQMTPAQVQQSTRVLPWVSLIMTLWLAYLTLRSRLYGWKLAAALFAVFYGLYTFLGQLELYAFPAVSSQMPDGTLNGLWLAGLMLTAPFSVAMVWLLGKFKPQPGENRAADRPLPAAKLGWKIAAGTLLYVAVYFIFGYFVAWRTPGLPEFYGGTDPGTFFGQLANVMRDTPWLFPFQVLRGLVWTGIGLTIVRMHGGRPWEVILATGLSFTILMNASLLFPMPFFPPDVARAHTIELVSSNLLYGILLASLLLWKPARAAVSIQKTQLAG